MELVIITVVSLLVYPPAAHIVIKLTKSYPIVRKRIIYISLVVTAITLLAMAAGISTLWAGINFLLFMSMYFTFSLLIILLFQQKQLLLKIAAGIAMFAVFGIGYLSSTIGLLGLCFVIGDIEATRSIPLTDNLIYKQYSHGNATSDFRKTEVAVYKTWRLFPFLQKAVFSKTYDVVFKGHCAKLSDLRPGEIYGYDFTVGYDKNKQQLLLYDSLRVYKLPVKH